MSITVREAVLSDLEQITKIGMSAFPSDPQWDYRYPYRKQYPKEHYDNCKQRWAEWLADSKTPKCKIYVAEIPSNEDSSVRKVQAFSIWKMPSHLADKGDKQNVKPPTYSHRADANVARLKAFRESSTEAEHRLLEPRYGNRRIELAQLVTHPDYQRRGLARELLKRGQQMASGGNFAVGVFASPVGRIVYEKFGFKVLGIAVVRAEGETETLELPVLGWEPAKFR